MWYKVGPFKNYVTLQGEGVTHSVTQCDKGEGELAIAICHTRHLYSACYHVVRFCLKTTNKIY